MSIHFDRPIGASSDVKELEYISALHQTDLHCVRKDGSIRDEDIRLFLLSRYGIDVTVDHVRDTVLKGLGGGGDIGITTATTTTGAASHNNKKKKNHRASRSDDDNNNNNDTILHDGECIDLMEMVAILLIPTFLKAAAQQQQQQQQQLSASTVTIQSICTFQQLHPKLSLPPPGLLQFVLRMILQDVTGDSKPKQLTPTLVQDILKAYGEYDIAANDALVQEMVKVAAAATTAVDGIDDASVAMYDSMTTTATRASDSTKNPEDTMINNDDNNNTPAAASDRGPQLLDVNAFAQALTYDVALYDVNNEVRISSNYDDIFLTHNVKDEVNNHVIDNNDDNNDDEEVGSIAGGSSVVSKQQRDQLSHSLKHRFTASSIDFAAGTYRSKGLTVLLWAAFIVTYFAYDFNFANDTVAKGICIPYNYTYNDPWVNNQEAIGCRIAANVYKWLVIFIFASIFGFAYVGLGSIGNSVQTKSACLPLIGLIAVFLLTFGHFRETVKSKEKLSSLSNKFLKIASLVLGLIVCAMHLLHALALLFPSVTRSMSALRLRYLALTGTLLGESYIKQAASYKLGEMVRNALDTLHRREQDGVVDTHFGHGLMSFSKHGKQFREEGGYMWTWKRAFNNELLAQEGLWFSARFQASNIAQYIVSVFVLLAGIGLTISAKKNFSEENAKRVVTKFLNQAVNTNTDPATVQAVTSMIGRKVTDYLIQNTNCSSSYYQDALTTACAYVGAYYECDPSANVSYACALANLTTLNETAYTATEQAAQNAYLQAVGFDASGTKVAIQQALQQASNSALESFYPSKRFMIVFPVAMATIIAFTVSLYLATTYLPSVTATTLKLRTGVIPTLRDKRFHQYRIAADQVTIVTGSMFWGALISSAVVGGLAALIIFLFIWQVTVVFVQRFLAFVIGITVVVLIKLVIVLTCRCTLYKGFYRKRPLAANLSSLALECANFALSAGFVFLRMLKLLFTAAVFIGRIDTPFLAPGVGKIGPLELDYYPYIYRKDILASEAHRHPYIETLGVMYLMKLRYGDNFGKSAGSCWRLLFVYALMPWLHRYRVLARPELLAGQGDGRQSLTRMHTVKSMRLFLHDVDVDDDDEEDTKDAEDRPISKLALRASEAFKHEKKEIEKVDRKGQVDVIQSTEKQNTEDGPSIEVVALKVENAMLKQEIEELKSQLLLAQSTAVGAVEDE